MNDSYSYHQLQLHHLHFLISLSIFLKSTTNISIYSQKDRGLSPIPLPLY
eukprot:m.10030 g.10030  ORF g.10030 m.10030 type:complete len:50 (+) comp3590_c1_seq1:175-324(+)